MTITLPDTTTVELARRWIHGPGGQHVGTAPLVVILRHAWSGDPIAFVSGLRSDLKTKQAIESCTYWQEVPLAIEATRWIHPEEP